MGLLNLWLSRRASSRRSSWGRSTSARRGGFLSSTLGRMVLTSVAGYAARRFYTSRRNGSSAASAGSVSATY